MQAEVRDMQRPFSDGNSKVTQGVTFGERAGVPQTFFVSSKPSVLSEPEVRVLGNAEQLLPQPKLFICF